MGFSWGASAGLTIPISKAFGEGNMDNVRKYVGASGLVSMLIAAFITAVGTIFSGPLLRWMSTPEELLPMATQFLMITMATSTFVVMLNWLSAVIRAVGDSKTPLYFLIGSSILNAGLSILMVGQMGLGVAGAAWGSAITQLMTVVACIIYGLKNMNQVFPNKNELAASVKAMWTPAKIGLPMGFQLSVIAIGTVLMQAAINGLGYEAVASATVAARIEMAALAMLNSFGVAMATFVAQNYGAKQYKRIRDGVLGLSTIAIISGMVFGLILWLYGTDMISLFLNNPSDEIRDLVYRHFTIGAIFYFALGLMFIVRNTIQSLGATKIATMSGVLELVVRGFTALMLVESLGWDAVIWGIPMGWTSAAILCTSAWLFYRKKLIKLEENLEEDLRSGAICITSIKEAKEQAIKDAECARPATREMAIIS